MQLSGTRLRFGVAAIAVAAISAMGASLISATSAMSQTVHKTVKTKTAFSAIKAPDGTITAELTYTSKDRHCLDDARFQLPHATVGAVLLDFGSDWEVGDPPGGSDVGWIKTSRGVYEKVIPPGGSVNVRPQGGGPITTFTTEQAVEVFMIGHMLTYKRTYHRQGKTIKLVCPQFTDSQGLPL